MFDGDDGKIKRRSYSLGSLPSDNILLEIGIIYIKGPAALFKGLLLQCGL